MKKHKQVWLKRSSDSYLWRRGVRVEGSYDLHARLVDSAFGFSNLALILIVVDLFQQQKHFIFLLKCQQSY